MIISKQEGDAMAQLRSRISKGGMSVRERDVRSRLAQMISSKGLLRGTLNPRGITCGKTGCKCARGDKHMYLYLVVSDGGKLRQILIPRSREEEVRRWVEQYQSAQELLEEISDLYREQIKKRKE
jgi:hypothetical protein